MLSLGTPGFFGWLGALLPGSWAPAVGALSGCESGPAAVRAVSAEGDRPGGTAGCLESDARRTRPAVRPPVVQRVQAVRFPVLAGHRTAGGGGICRPPDWDRRLSEASHVTASGRRPVCGGGPARDTGIAGKSVKKKRVTPWNRKLRRFFIERH